MGKSPPQSTHLTRTPGGAPIGTITVEITRRCHRKCVFCYLQAVDEETGAEHDELSAAEIAHHIGLLMNATGCTNVQLSGGEPFLRQDLLEIVGALQHLGARVSIITDGGRISPTLAQELANRKVGPLQTTLLAAEESLHDSLRGKHSFRQITRGIATATAAGLEVNVSMVITSVNYDRSAEVGELSYALGAKGLALSRFLPTGRGVDASLMPTGQQIRRAVQLAAAKCRTLSFPLAAAVTIPTCVWENPAKPGLACGVCSLVGPRTTVTVGPEGQVRSCTLDTQSVGNVCTESWEVLSRRLWKQRLGPLRQETPERCSGCEYWETCLGGCRLSGRRILNGFCLADPLAQPVT